MSKEILGLIAAAMLLLPASRHCSAVEPAGAGEGYVVLTDLAESDPYFAAARRLQEHRSARLIRFPPGRVAETVDAIREAQPAFVAVVVRPETLDVNFAYEVLEIAVKVDDDPFTDFAYGFVTGATAADALGLVERTIAAEAGPPPSSGRLLAFGPTNTPQADQGSAFEWLPAWQRQRIEHKPGRFPRRNLKDLAGADVIRFWGHGAPDGVEGSLAQSDLSGIGIRARMVFAGPCFSAVTGRYYDEPKYCGNLEARCVKPGKSLALTFLSKGALSYFGALQEDRCLSAGQEMECALTSGEPVGMALKHTQDRIVMAQTNGGMRFARLRAGVPRPGEKGLEAQLRLAAARILLGDPAFQPFPAQAGPAMKTTVQRTGAALSVEAIIVDPRIRSSFVNPFRHDLCTCDTDNDTLYIRTPVPKAAGPICGVRRVTLPACLESVKHGAVLWREEDWHGERFLHLRIDFRHDALGEIAPNTVVRFDAETQPGAEREKQQPLSR